MLLQRTNSSASRKGSRESLLPTSNDDLARFTVPTSKKSSWKGVFVAALCLTVLTGLAYWALYSSDNQELNEWMSDYSTVNCSKNKAHKFSLCQTCSTGVPATIRQPQQSENGDITLFYNARWAVPLKMQSPDVLSNNVNGVDYELVKSEIEDNSYQLSVKLNSVEMCVIDLRQEDTPKKKRKGKENVPRSNKPKQNQNKQQAKKQQQAKIPKEKKTLEKKIR